MSTDEPKNSFEDITTYNDFYEFGTDKSDPGWMRRLGRRWQRLHRLVYPAAILGCVHYWWQVKADLRERLLYATILLLLLGWRLHRARASARARARSPG